MERGQKYSLGGEGVVVVVMGLGGGVLIESRSEER